MATTTIPEIPPPHFRDRFIIDGPEKPTHLQNYQRATKYILHRFRKGSRERQNRRAMVKGGMKYDNRAPTNTMVEPEHVVAEQTEAVYLACQNYSTHMKYCPEGKKCKCKLTGPKCLWDAQAGVSPDWASPDKHGEMNCVPSAVRWGYSDDPEYDMDLPPNETLEEAIQVYRRQTEPAPVSAEAKEAREADKKGRRASISGIFSFIRRRLSHSHHH